MITKNMKQVEELLYHDVFFRTHQSYIVNLNHVKEFHKNDGGYIMMEDNVSIPVSRINKKLLLEAMSNL